MKTQASPKIKYNEKNNDFTSSKKKFRKHHRTRNENNSQDSIIRKYKSLASKELKMEDALILSEQRLVNRYQGRNN